MLSATVLRRLTPATKVFTSLESCSTSTRRMRPSMHRRPLRRFARCLAHAADAYGDLLRRCCLLTLRAISVWRHPALDSRAMVVAIVLTSSVAEISRIAFTASLVAAVFGSPVRRSLPSPCLSDWPGF